MNQLQTWVNVPDNSDFTIYNLPYGIFKTEGKKPRVGIAIGESILDLHEVHKLGFFKDLTLPDKIFRKKYLNDFIALGRPIWSAVRKRLIEILSVEETVLPKYADVVLKPQNEAIMMLPVKVGDYTDFYSSIEHATNVGKMFRDPENALLPNWKHIPVGYHGRASSILVSGSPIHRPKGQTMPPNATQPVFGPTKRLDIELEMAFIVGRETNPGQSIPVDKTDDFIFGMVLFNDWSARDIQKWEYVPLGPFLGKNFASSTSPWVVTMEALEPFKVSGPEQDPKVLPYLNYNGDKNYDIELEVSLQPQDGEENIISRSNFKYMYWNMAQQLAHHTVNGCNVKVGDMMASGTISGKEVGSYGSLLEITWSGKNPITLNDGTQRTFLENNDTVYLRGHAKKGAIRVGFGEVSGKILPSIDV
ncbi:MAG: fumarylacetoacetase [Chitinophagales bacterium]